MKFSAFLAPHLRVKRLALRTPRGVENQELRRRTENALQGAEQEATRSTLTIVSLCE